MIMVTIRCLVYNHAVFLRECLDGIVSQKTDFPFEAVVHDDASTDGSASIIREYEAQYPAIIRGVYETENQYSKRDGSLDRIMDSEIRGKYVAICEGDDYWTDPLKLQKQVDYLEGHPECGMVHGRARAYSQSEGDYLEERFGLGFPSFEKLIKRNTVVTFTTMFRSELYFSYLFEIQPYIRGWKMGDYPLWLYISRKSVVYFMDEVLGVYRITEGSASHGDYRHNIDFKQNALDISLFFASFSGCSYLIPAIEDSYHKTMLHIAYKANSCDDVRKYFSLLHHKRLKDYVKLLLSRIR